MIILIYLHFIIVSSGYVLVTHPLNNNNDIKDKQNAWLLVKLVYLYFDLNWEQPRTYNLNPCTLYLAF